MNDSPAAVVRRWITDSHKTRSFTAVVTGTSGQRIFVQRPGQSSADPTAYPALAWYFPVIGQTVLVLVAGDTPIVLGEVLT